MDNMANLFQENLNIQLEKKRKIPQKTGGRNTKNMINTGISYNVMHEHNYFYDLYKIRSEQVNKKKYLQNDIDTIPDWFGVPSSSDIEDFDEYEDKPLSQILKFEHQHYLLDKYKNRKSTDNLLPFYEYQMYYELNNTNNLNSLHMTNDSNNNNK